MSDGLSGIYKTSVETLEFNRTHGRFYTDEEFARRKKESEPYRLFQLTGGAGANATLIGNYHIEWYTLYKKAVQILGTDDADIIDDWVQKQYNRIMGIENPVPTLATNTQTGIPQFSAEGQTLLGGPSA